MAIPSPDKGSITDAEIAGYMGWGGPGAYTEASLRKIRQIIDHVQRVERATPQSPSTAPEVKPWQQRYEELAKILPAPRKAGTPKNELRAERHKSSFRDAEIAELRAALASRPAEVDDEGLPALPFPFKRLIGEGIGGYSDVFTAEQYRQGQRDAVAADRARRRNGQYLDSGME